MMETRVLQIRKRGAGFVLALLAGDQVVAEAALPAAPAGLDHAAAKAAIRAEQSDVAELEAQGSALFRLLAENAAGEKWLERYEQGDLRTLLDLQGDWADLPWELVYNDRYLFQRKPAPWARGSAKTRERATEPLVGPVRVLILCGEKEGGPAAAEGIRAEEEIHRVRHALATYGRLVEVRVERAPPVDSLRDLLLSAFRPHLFHFIGHGDTIDGKMFLRVGDDPWFVSAIRNLLDEWRPHVALLNACLTAAGGESAALTVAGAFAGAGTHAVLGMQARIRGDSAGDLLSPVYRALLEGRPIDQELAYRRQDLDVKYPNRHDWAIPSLFLNTAPERVLPLDRQVADEAKDIEEFRRSRFFVDRVVARHALCGFFRPISSPGEAVKPGKLALIHGAPGTGRTSLMLYCLEACLVGSWRLVCRNLNSDRSLDFLDVLRLIRDGDTGAGQRSIYRKHLEPAAFNAFNHRLNHLEDCLQGRALPPMPAGIVAEVGPDRALPANAVAEYPELGRLFREALVTAAQGHPLLLALDHLKIEEDQFKRFLVPYLVQPLAADEASPIHLLVVTRTGSPYQEALAPLCDKGTIELKEFSASESYALLHEYCTCFAYPLHKDVAQTLELLAKLWGRKPTWPPRMLAGIENTLDLGGAAP